MSTSTPSVHLVLQRYRTCKILLEETEWVTQGWTTNEVTENSTISSQDEPHCGLLIYISFATNADKLSCINAAETCLNMPILTSGLWGDGSSQQFSIKSHLSQANSSKQKNTSITIVPQANLICKTKSQGTSIQYHSQIEKDAGRELYNLFVDYIGATIFEYQCMNTGEETPDWFQEWKTQIHQLTKDPTVSPSFDPSTAPVNMFRFMDPPMYGSFDDETGLPLTDLSDAPLSKSSLKKLRKAQDLHSKRHQKWLQQQGHSEVPPEYPAVAVDAVNNCRTPEDKDNMPTFPGSNCRPVEDWKSTLDSSFCMVVGGTYGKRQGLEILSDMGPFCHVVQI